jgi:tellurite resistance protein TehA-like permease
VFAVVMATGVVAIAASGHGYWRIAVCLRALAAAAAVVLAAWFAVRALTQTSRVMRLLRDPDVALPMFTVVAACAVIAACWPAEPVVGLWLAWVGLAAWLALIPLAGVVVCSRHPTQLRDQAHGAWLLPSVATQGLAVTTADVARHTGFSVLLSIAVAAWLIAVLIYLAVCALIGWRALSLPFRPDQVTPDSWILMGALAIAALAGSHILAAARALDASGTLVGSAHSATWWVWVAASVWIPVLLYAQVWRVDHLTGSLHYHRVWWAAVFPIGMYSAASSSIAAVLGVRSLVTVSLVFFWVAFTLWVVVTVGLLHMGVAQYARRIVSRPPSLRGLGNQSTKDQQERKDAPDTGCPPL